MIPFEAENVEAYRLLLRIEIALRELVGSTMEAQIGRDWRKRLPGRFLKKIRESQREEESRRQFDYLTLGPLYYLTFGELLEVLREKPAEAVARRLGGQVFLQSLESLTSPRNAISHARAVSAAGLATVRAVHKQLEAALTRESMLALLAHPDTGIYPSEAMLALRSWLMDCLKVVESLGSPCPASDAFSKASEQYWWGSTELVPFDSGLVGSAAELLREYDRLPASLGAKAVRISFVRERKLCDVITRAIKALEVSE
jgi:hypothetical protein